MIDSTPMQVPVHRSLTACARSHGPSEHLLTVEVLPGPNRCVGLHEALHFDTLLFIQPDIVPCERTSTAMIGSRMTGPARVKASRNAYWHASLNAISLLSTACVAPSVSAIRMP